MCPQRPARPMHRSTTLSPLQVALALLGLIALGAGIGLIVVRGASAPPAAAPPQPAESATAPATQRATEDPSLAEPTPIASQPAPQARTQVAVPAGMPLPVALAGDAAFGVFELGGAVDGELAHPEHMKSAGMTWVSYDIAWHPDLPASSVRPLVEQGHRHGLKVLLTVRVAQRRAPGSDAAAFVDFLRRVAYYGPDAIEIWPGANDATSWPRGEIDGRKYTQRVLAPGFNAIKQVNRNILVIAGAPEPETHYDGGCSDEGYGCEAETFLTQMAAAGAANYTDCVGAHALRVDHAAPDALEAQAELYGSIMGRPVCFTRYGVFSPEGFGEPPDSFAWAASVTTAQQAEWLGAAVQRATEGNQMRLLIVWNVDYLGWADQSPGAGYAILRPEGACPACVTLGEVMRQRRGQ